jgi:hypothetical protein
MMKKRIIDIFSEREGDEQQIRDAEEIYYKILNNFNKVKTIPNLSTIFNFSDILGYEFYLSFIDNGGKGHGFGYVDILDKNVRYRLPGLIFDFTVESNKIIPYLENNQIKKILAKQ